jgi:hypothetical protein
MRAILAPAAAAHAASVLVRGRERVMAPAEARTNGDVALLASLVRRACLAHPPDGVGRPR